MNKYFVFYLGEYSEDWIAMGDTKKEAYNNLCDMVGTMPDNKPPKSKCVFYIAVEDIKLPKKSKKVKEYINQKVYNINSCDNT